MTFLKNLWADLIEKRLWPIAVVLLIALVAVPVFLGSGGEEPVDAAALGATGETGGLGSEAQVSLDEPGAVRRDREGKLRDPFKQRAVPDTGTSGANGAGAVTGTAAQPGTTAQVPSTGGQTGGGGSSGSGGFGEGSGSSGGGGSGGGSGSPGAGSGSSGGGPGSGSGGGGSDSTPSAPALSTYVTELRLGRAGAAQPRRTVARLTPLPSVAQPSFVHLGVLSDRRTAVFLLSSDVTATGQGACKPSKRLCETVELREGETETLTVTNDDDSTSRFTLSVLSVRRRGTAATDGTTTQVKSAPKAKTAAREQASDEDLGTGRYAYDDDTGLLRRVRRARTAKLGAHLPGAEGASSVDLSGVGGGGFAALPAEGPWEMSEFSPIL